MLAAATADFAAIPDAAVVTLLDHRLHDRQLDPRVEVHRVSSETEADAFRTIAGQVDHAMVIAPETEGILLKRCIWAAEAGAKLLGPKPDAVALASDKLRLAQHWTAAGVPTPPTMEFAWQTPTLPAPWIVKPRFGAGSEGIRLVRDHSDHRIPFLLSPEPPGPIVQSWIPGRAASVAFLGGPNQTVSLPPCWQILDKEFHYLGGSTPIPEPFTSRARRIAEQAIATVPGLRGYFGVDVVLGEQDVAIEINPRLTTSYIGLRQLAKSNLAEALITIVRGEHVDLQWGNETVHFTP
jgi:predicted ATP-grasp superfamily ATP-dependent carboligase